MKWAPALIVPALVLAAGAPAAASDQDTTDPATTDPAGQLVIGDSIAWYSSDAIHRLRPDWTIDARRGRLVSLLDDRVAAAAAELPPAVVVMELGTNVSDTWTRADYQAAVDALPAETQKFLVTPVVFHEPRHRVRKVRQYARWMKRVATGRSDVHIIGWRRTATRRPHLLRDGVHPNTRGQRILARLMVRRVDHVLQKEAPASTD